jgi:hypothetical protein
MATLFGGETSCAKQCRSGEDYCWSYDNFGNRLMQEGSKALVQNSQSVTSREAPWQTKGEG